MMGKSVLNLIKKSMASAQWDCDRRQGLEQIRKVVLILITSSVILKANEKTNKISGQPQEKKNNQWIL